ncbi:MAG: TolC family protein [Candidatus Wallbacteria bacterium]|nr:TolC family protein [Candidatus Wallbacteria bacterium]
METLILAFMIFFSATSWGAGTAFSDTVAVSLNEAVSIALCNNPEINASQALLGKADEDYKAALGLNLPEISARKSSTRLDSPMELSVGPMHAAITDERIDLDKLVLNWPLYMGGKIQAGIKAADLARNVAEFSAVLTREKIILQVSENYLGYLKAARLETVIREAIETVNSHRHDVEKAVENGAALESDLLRVDVRLAELRKNLIEVKNGRNLALAALIKNLGTDKKFRLMENDRLVGCGFSADSAETTAEISILVNLLPESPDGFVSYAGIRPELKLISFNRRMLAEAEKAERADNYPQVFLQYENHSGTELSEHDGGYSYTWVLNWKFFDGGRSGHKSKALHEQARAVSFQEQDVKSGLTLMIRSDFFNLLKFRSQLECGKSEVAAAKKNLSVVTAQYKGGAVNNSNYLDAQLELNKAETDLFSTEYDCYLAYYRFMKSIGKLEKMFPDKLNTLGGCDE